MQAKINWLGVIGGALTIALIGISLFVPWWQFAIGNPKVIAANFSPVNLNFAVGPTPINIPLILALNVATALSLLAGAITLIIYSVQPTKSYAKSLLGFGYNKPLFAVILFVVEIVVLTLAVKSVAGLSLPLTGSANLQIPSTMVGNNISGTILVSASFEWPFFFAIAVAAICITARLYHGKLVRLPPPPPQPKPFPQYVPPPPSI
jgi:hypothetical protein